MPTTPPCPSTCPWPAPVTSVPTQAEALVFEFPEEAILLAFLTDPSLRCAGCPPGLGMALYTWLTLHSPQPFSDDFLEPAGSLACSAFVPMRPCVSQVCL